jgi:uridine kinase
MPNSGYHLMSSERGITSHSTWKDRYSMKARHRTVVVFLLENIPLLLTVILAVLVVVPKQGAELNVLVRWLVGLVGLLALSEFVQRASLLRRIDASAAETLRQVQKLAAPLATRVYPNRIDAAGDVREAVASESEGLSIVAGSLGGTLRLIPDLPEVASQGKGHGLNTRILLCHPDWMARRAEQEGVSATAQRRRTWERLHMLLEQSDVPLECIRLYRATPTCSTIVLHAQRKLLVNPYPLKNPAENTLSILLDGAVYPEAFDRFVDAHLTRPWRSDSLSVSLETFAREQTAALAKAIARTARKKYLDAGASRPVLIAINGCTAAGKTGLAIEVASRLRDETGPELTVVVLDTDGWIKMSRAERLSRGLTCCQADAYDVEALKDSIQRLASRREAQNRAYDHHTGMPRDAGKIGPGDVIVVDGLMSTHRRVGLTCDVRVWIELSREAHKQLRIDRDIKERRYTRAAADQNWELHARVWNDFEELARPSDCLCIRSNRARMLFAEE